MAGFDVGGGSKTKAGCRCRCARRPGCAARCTSPSAGRGSSRDDERRWLQAVVSQCAQAFERSRLFDAELRLRRRSDRVQSMTAALSGALTRADVAKVVVDEIVPGAGATATALGRPGGAAVSVEAWPGAGTSPRRRRRLEISLDEPTPGNRALGKKPRVGVLREARRTLASRLPASRPTAWCSPSTSRSYSSRSCAGRPCERARRHVLGGAGMRSSTRTGVHRDARGPGRPGTRPRKRSSSPSRRSRRRFSGASCPPPCRGSRACSSLPATCPAPPGWTSAATGSTRSACRTASSGSRSATSSAKGSRPPRRWASSGTRCERSRSTR